MSAGTLDTGSYTSVVLGMGPGTLALVVGVSINFLCFGSLTNHFYCDWSKKSKRKNAVLYNTKLLGVHMGIWIFLTRLRRAYGLQVALS